MIDTDRELLGKLLDSLADPGDRPGPHDVTISPHATLDLSSAACSCGWTSSGYYQLVVVETIASRHQELAEEGGSR